MSVTLRSKEIAQLQKALETILTPIAHSSPTDWGNAVMRDVKTLLRADQAFFALPLDASVHITGTGDRTEEAGEQYERDYWQTDFVIGKRRRESRLEVYHRDQLYMPGELERDVLHNEWCVPNKLFDTLGMGVDVSGGPIPAGVNVYHNSASSIPFGERGQALMHLLVPAFKASVLSYGLLMHLRESMSKLIDHMPNGACIIDSTGLVLFENVALSRLYCSDPESFRLRAAVQRVANEIVMLRMPTSADPSSRSHPFEQVNTAINLYEIRGTSFAEPSSLPGSAGLIFVDARPHVQVIDEDAAVRVRQRFGLTRREIEVALLLARRLTADEIAATLGISSHTARHHTENIFSKTSVTSRAMIAGLFES